MLTLKDLVNRIYDGKKCIGFTYTVTDKSRSLDDPSRECFEAQWKAGVEPRQWQVRIVLDRNGVADSQVYNFTYTMPRSGLSLPLIAATGLRYMQMQLQQEIQNKSNANFVIGELLKDM